MSQFLFTVFTPLYNRKHTIDRVWKSLMEQTNKNFEWLIVNDGSEDGIEPILESYKNKADFPVRIFHQKNSGKHIAFNKAIDEAKGELLIPADSDDTFIPSTIETFEKYWKKYKDESISGISVLCKDENENIIGNKFLFEGVSNHINVVYKQKIKGEKWGCVRVDILKKYKFPDMFGSKYFPLGYMWEPMGLEYNIFYLNIPLRTYFQDAENQLTNRRIFSLGTLKASNFYAIWWMNNIFPKVYKYLTSKEVLRKYLSIWKSSFLINRSFFSVINDVEYLTTKIFVIMFYLPAFLLFRIFKYKM